MAKKHGHEAKHAHCEHCLHACDHCEVAYCCDCNKEWGTCRRQHDYWWFTSPHIYGTTTIYPSDTTTITSDAFVSTSNTYTIPSVSDHAHAHTN